MKIIPSIDIQNGACVRLKQGDFTSVSKYAINPIDGASEFYNSGATVLHIVDLDGAKSGKISQIDCIKAIRGVFKKTIQVGGGIRDDADIDALLNIGIDRVVIGSTAVLDPKKTTRWFEQYGADAIVLALDFMLEDGVPYVMIKGWQEKTKVSVWDVLALYPKLNHVLCTDISKDGMQSGPNSAFYQSIKTRYPNIKVQASGGVSSLDDIKKLAAYGIDAAIIGKAFYEGALDLKTVMTCLK